MSWTVEKEVSFCEMIHKLLEYGPSEYSLWLVSMGFDPGKKPLAYAIDEDRQIVTILQ